MYTYMALLKAPVKREDKKSKCEGRDIRECMKPYMEQEEEYLLFFSLKHVTIDDRACKSGMM